MGHILSSIAAGFSGLMNTFAAKTSDIVLRNLDMSDIRFLEREISMWKTSPERMMQIKGHLYYDGDHDILYRKRTAIGEKGELIQVENLPNNRLIDNQYAKLVNQKANYLLGQPFAMESNNKQYAQALKTIFDKRFMKMLKSAGKSMLEGGICWIYPYYTEDGKFSFRVFPAYEILPFWSDTEHTKIDAAVRLYLVAEYKGSSPSVTEKVEVFTASGIHRYVLRGSTLSPDVDLYSGRNASSYASAINQDGSIIPLNWSRIPLIPLKYNECETSLLKKVKTLQDGINIMLSDFANNMQEDARNTILVLKNYDGTNLGEFRRNLATYGVVKVRYDGETKGGVETLEINVNADNYKIILDLLKKALIENGMGYDAKDDRLSGNPNQMNIQSMYSDIDLDANDMETELQATFEELIWFVNAHLENTGQGSFDGEDVNIIFNRDILISENDSIANCRNSVGILSDETIVSMHPWVDDPEKEMQRLKKQKEEAQTEFEKQQNYNPFDSAPNSNEGGEPPSE